MNLEFIVSEESREFSDLSTILSQRLMGGAIACAPWHSREFKKQKKGKKPPDAGSQENQFLDTWVKSAFLAKEVGEVGMTKENLRSRSR